jgi:cobalt-zinc-cadmium efflux system outer membrane protein
MRTLLVALAMSLAGTAWVEAGPVADRRLPAIDDVDALVAFALESHPTLAAASAGADAAAARVRQSGSLPDPVIMWGEMIEPVETRVGPQERVLSVQQPLPWPGVLGARRDAAAVGAAMAGESRRDAGVRVAADVRRAWAAAVWVSEVQAVTDRQVALVARLESSVRAAYESGRGRYADLLQIQLERARLEDRRRGLDDDASAALARLAAALGVAPGSLRDLPAPLSLDAPMATMPAEADTLVHPGLVTLDLAARAARDDARAARAAGMPSFVLGVDWIQVGPARMDGVDGSGNDAVVAKVGMTVPLWRGKHDGAVDVAEARARALEADRAARGLALSARADAARAAGTDATRRIRTHLDDLLPRARQVCDVQAAVYAAGDAALTDVLAAHRMILDLEQSLAAARRDLVIATADYHEAVGGTPAAILSTRRSDP